MKHWAWMNHKLESISGRNISNFRYADDTTLVRESEEDPKSLLKKVNEESEKTGLKLNIQNMKIMAFGPILHGKYVKSGNSDRFIFLCSRISVDGDCSHERCLLLRKSLSKLWKIVKE